MSKVMMIALDVAFAIVMFVTGLFVGELRMKDRVVVIETQRDEMIVSVKKMTASLNESTEILNRSTWTLNRCDQVLRGAQ